MLPDDVLSTQAVVYGSVDPVKRPGDFLVDYERGGRALNDPSDGLRTQVWTLEVERDKTDIDTWHVYARATLAGKHLLFSATHIEEASLAFDQNMRPFVAYVQQGVTKYWWYDSTVPGQVHTTLGAGYRSPRCTTDEKRDWHLELSDIMLFYIKGNTLYRRQQRDRFTNEKALKVVGNTAEIVSVTMSTGSRLQIRIRNSTVTADDPQATVMQNPYLSDVVADLCIRAGIQQEYLDVNDLYGHNIVGYLVDSDDKLSDSMQPLNDAFFFDAAEFDRKLRFLRRGRDANFTFSYDDLVDADPAAMKQTRADETKLPLRVDVTHQDPAGGFSKNKQSAYRKSNLVQAKGKESLDFAFAISADESATIALKKIKERWHELMDYEFALPIAFTHVVPTDVGIYTDEDGVQYRIRIKERNESDGVIKFKGKLDGGTAVYGTKANGLSLPPPTSTAPGVIGETRLELLNLPPMKDQDDELGIYVAMGGTTSAWYGAELLISTDDGANYIGALQNEVPATMGDTETDLLAEVSAEYPSSQSIVVKTNYPLESVPYETLLNNYNRAVIGDEVIQFQTAENLGDNRFRLSGLIRGRYDTDTEFWPAGTRFVLIDTALMFLQAQQWMLGKEILFKPVSFGTLEDDAVPTSYQFDRALSQTEWAPSIWSARRVGNGIHVIWNGRGRLGIETAPRQGKYFTGYKLRFSDGFTASVGPDVKDYSRSGNPPANITVEVCGLNSITGDGNYSDEVAV